MVNNPYSLANCLSTGDPRCSLGCRRCCPSKTRWAGQASCHPPIGPGSQRRWQLLFQVNYLFTFVNKMFHCLLSIKFNSTNIVALYARVVYAAMLLRTASTSRRAARRSRSTRWMLRALERSWGEAIRSSPTTARPTPSTGSPTSTDSSRLLLTCPSPPSHKHHLRSLRLQCFRLSSHSANFLRSYHFRFSFRCSVENRQGKIK